MKVYDFAARRIRRSCASTCREGSRCAVRVRRHPERTEPHSRVPEEEASVGCLCFELDDGSHLTESLRDHGSTLRSSTHAVDARQDAARARARVREAERICEIGAQPGWSGSSRTRTPLRAAREAESPEAAESARSRLQNASRCSTRSWRRASSPATRPVSAIARCSPHSTRVVRGYRARSRVRQRASLVLMSPAAAERPGMTPRSIVPSPPRPGQESVWQNSATARIELSPRHVVVVLGGEVVARPRARCACSETSQPPVYYIPPGDYRRACFRPTANETLLRVQGCRAATFDLVVGERAAPGSMGVREPGDALCRAARLRRHLSGTRGRLLPRRRAGARSGGRLLRRLDHERRRRTLQGRPGHAGLVAFALPARSAGVDTASGRWNGWPPAWPPVPQA